MLSTGILFRKIGNLLTSDSKPDIPLERRILSIHVYQTLSGHLFCVSSRSMLIQVSAASRPLMYSHCLPSSYRANLVPSADDSSKVIQSPSQAQSSDVD